jgi:phosphate transport system substrate-binding protein
MRILVLAAGLLISPLAAAQLATPEPDARVKITTPMITYTGVFVREENAPNTNATVWVVRTDSGTARIPRSIVRQVELVGAMPRIPVPDRREEEPPLAREVGGLDLRIHGSNTIGAKLAPEFARAYAERNGLSDPATKMQTPEDFDVEYSTSESDRKYVFRFAAHGSTTAFQDLLGNVADIGMSSRRIKDDEVKILQDAGLGNLKAPKAENVVALDGVAVIVNKANPVDALSLDQISRIFSGEIQDWQQLGGAPGPINIYSRDAQSGTFDTFKTLVLEGNPKRALAASAKRFESSEELSDSVAADPRGVGFIGFAYIRSAKALQIATSCGLRFAADPFLVRSEEYPLSRRLFFYVPEPRRTAQVDNFVKFALSAGAQPVSAAVGFIGLNIEEAPASYTSERGKYRNLVIGTTTSASAPRLVRQFSEAIEGAQRLSVTFRFNTGSTDLDNRAIEDVTRLAGYMKANPGAAQHIMLFGFADQRGNFERNLELSRDRALQVANALSAIGVNVQQSQTYGFGVIAPAACSDSDVALEKNRRVEVWLRH